MLINNEKLENYIINHTADEDPVLQELYRQTHLKIYHPRMISGHLQGRVLNMLCHMIKAERILEIGTFTGYSAICMAQALGDTGKLISIDHNDELEDFTRLYLEKAGVNDKVDFRIGNALDIIDELDEEFDLVFIDAEKSEYLDYYKLVFDKVKQGGYIIADNALWDGKVVDENESEDLFTKGILAFNDFVHKDPRVENLLLPVRDGLMILRKK